ncbi:unnamed protein product [Prunus armeniaca]|uniref:Uncharacterized protein n=1 Tax=Prunus armeniaca TaxID=36596 RepID=A0A6J5WCZ8_PRUAR|nr:unnamed protein product [Prunus armeniaca]
MVERESLGTIDSDRVSEVLAGISSLAKIGFAYARSWHRVVIGETVVIGNMCPIGIMYFGMNRHGVCGDRPHRLEMGAKIGAGAVVLKMYFQELLRLGTQQDWLGGMTCLGLTRSKFNMLSRT